jgi:hypothetical protein
MNTTTNTKLPQYVTLAALCAELKLDQREARMSLRLAVKDKKTYPDLGVDHLPRQPWQWVKGSPAEAQARKALSAPIPA